jgi:hypothetical protein
MSKFVVMNGLLVLDQPNGCNPRKIAVFLLSSIRRPDLSRC